ncbi:uncharacterized protein LOC130690487 [Daphnia carinata]|uniref:uncharacterized protein LOC130690487 n=1 Tax=Daphnia carinata TaxID=120202 RepID=UPI00257ABDAC|nr:uncharacterized protein LOC130690487 [Daphnia carinata]
MRSILSVVTLMCLLSAVHFQPSTGVHQPSSIELKGLIQKGLDELQELHAKDVSGPDVISSRKLGLGIKAILLKPLLLVALAKIKLALLLGKPFALLALKKLLLKGALGKLLLKIPLILLGGKAVILAKVLALKFALVTKGLIGLKAPLALLFLGGFLKGAIGGSGLGLALGLASSLLKLKGLGANEEHDEPSYTYVPPPPPAYSPSYSSAQSARAPPPYSPASPVHSAGPSYSDNSGANVGANHFGADYGSSASGHGGDYGVRRGKRDTEGSDEEFDEESVEDLQLEFEAARTNGNAYLYMAAQFDEQSCGRRLMCEIYQKPKESLTDDENILQDIFGYPLSSLNEEDKDTPREWYYRAAQLGASHQGRSNIQICAQFFSTCPYNAQQLIHIFITEDIRTNEIESNHQPSAHLKPPQSNVRLPFYHQHQTISNVQQRKPIEPVHEQHPQVTQQNQG